MKPTKPELQKLREIMDLKRNSRMTEIIKNLEYLVSQVSKYISESSEEIVSKKPNPEKWSKKEILGHLVDSGINNLQRFTEIQFKEKPFTLKSYNQVELVKANRYQDAETNEILDLLKVINRRIIDMIKLQTDKTLHYEIINSENEKFDLKYLIEDYVKHFEHHTKQIVE